MNFCVLSLALPSSAWLCLALPSSFCCASKRVCRCPAEVENLRASSWPRRFHGRLGWSHSWTSLLGGSVYLLQYPCVVAHVYFQRNGSPLKRLPAGWDLDEPFTESQATLSKVASTWEGSASMVTRCCAANCLHRDPDRVLSCFKLCQVS